MGYKKIKVARYNIDGILIDVFDSYTDLAKEIGLPTAAVSTAIRLDNKRAGFYFRPVKNHVEDKIELRKYRRGGKEIFLYIKPNTLFKKCSCIQEASDITGISTTSIRFYLRNKKWHVKGFKFIFVDPEDEFRKIGIFKQKYTPSKNRNHMTPVILIDLDQKKYPFESISEAARSLNISRVSIIHVLSGRQKNVGGYKAVYQ